MTYRVLDFFTDPILRDSTIGCMLMCLVASLVGVIVFVRRKSLVGEVLSHAAYPGLAIGAALLSCICPLKDGPFFAVFLVGAFMTAWLALLLLQKLQKGQKVKGDAALCFILSSFFGIGIVVASYLQTARPLWYRQVQVFLYGQAATMTDTHVWIYGVLVVLVLLFLSIFYRPLQLLYFDGQWARALGFPTRLMEGFFSVFLVFAVTVAMKSVGVVLLSGMLVAPALGARRVCRTLGKMFWGAGFLGVLSGFIGNYTAVKLSEWQQESHLIFPTGPMIVLTSSFFAIVLVVFSFRRIRNRCVR